MRPQHVSYQSLTFKLSVVISISLYAQVPTAFPTASKFPEAFCLYSFLFNMAYFPPYVQSTNAEPSSMCDHRSHKCTLRCCCLELCQRKSYNTTVHWLHSELARIVMQCRWCCSADCIEKFRLDGIDSEHRWKAGFFENFGPLWELSWR